MRFIPQKLFIANLLQMKHISKYSKWKYVFSILLIGFFSSLNVVAQTNSNVIYYNSDTIKLKGYLFKPKGKGPFPVYMWNHDEGKYADSNRQLINFWTKHGFIFFMPIRSGHSDNPGTYIVDAERQIKRRKEMESLRWKQTYALHEKANEDVMAALKWIKKQPQVDTNNIVVSGEDYGAIQVLLTAAKDGQTPLGVKSFVAFFSMPSYELHFSWRDSLLGAINIAKRPVFLLQETVNVHASPIDYLGPVLNKKQFPNRYKVYNTTGYEVDPEQWEKDVMKYLKDCKVKRVK